MKKLFFMFIAMIMCTAVYADTISGEQIKDATIKLVTEHGKPKTIRLEAAYQSKRTVKGFVTNPEAVVPVKIEAEWEMGFYAGVAGVLDTTSYNSEREVNRFQLEDADVILGYRKVLANADYVGDFLFDFGYLNTHWMDDMKWDYASAHELFFDVTAVDVIVKPGVKIYWDTQHDFVNFMPHISWQKELGAFWTFNTSLEVYFSNRNYNKKLYGVDRPGFSVARLTGEFMCEVQQYVKVGPMFEMTYALDRGVRDTWKTAESCSAFNGIIGIKAVAEF